MNTAHHARLGRWLALCCCAACVVLMSAGAASAQVSFARAWGWGVLDGASQLETCTTTCQRGIAGSGAGQLYQQSGVAVDGSGDVFVVGGYSGRVAEFSSDGAFIKAWGWGVLDGRNQLETCTTSCEGGVLGSGAGQLYYVEGVAVDGSGDVFVADNGNYRIDEFTSDGAFVKAWGWGVLDGKSQLETCTTSCQSGVRGGGAGQLNSVYGIAVDGSGDVFVADFGANRLDEFSSAGTFIRAWGWGVLDGASQLETCTTSCQSGVRGGGAGQFYSLLGVAVDGSGDVFAVDGPYRVDEFSSAGAFVKAWGWGVLDGASQFETCTTTCQLGVGGGGAGELGGGSDIYPYGIAADRSGDVFVADNGNSRVDEFTSTGAFVEVWGWGVLDGAAQFETCATSCMRGTAGTGAAQLYAPVGVAVDGSGDVFEVGGYNPRVDEFGGASLAQNTLTVSKTGTGSGSVTSTPAGIDCGATCSATFDAGSQVTLTATPAAGSSFSGWSGACTGTGSCVVTMSQAQSVTASFSLLSETLSVTSSGSGSGSVSSSPAGISCGSTCTHAFDYETSVTLTATPTAGSSFSGWSGACSGTGTCTVTMSAATSVTATFGLTKVPGCVVPKVRGKALAAAKRAIKRAGCSVGRVKKAISRTVKKGHVISQKPKPHTRLERGAKVNLVVSRGPRS